MKRTATRDQVAKWLNEQLAQHPECEGIEVLPDGINLLENPDVPSGANWDLSTLHGQRGVGYPRCEDYLKRELLPRAKRLFNVTGTP
jgi:hypothetical protein